MTPQQILKSAILEQVAQWNHDEDIELYLKGPFDTQEKIDAAFEVIEKYELHDELSEAKEDLRGSYTLETDIE
jgi:hypothetical protein